MRTLLIALAGFLALLVLVVLVGPLLVDWNAFKPRLAAAVEEATGRSLVIEGDLQLSVLPTPTLSASGARLSNLEGGSEPTMVSLETLEVQVALAPLLGGDLQVRSLVLVEPTILLERLEDGRVNWDLAPPRAATQGAAPETPSESGADEPASGGDAPLSVTLDRVTIENGTLIYRDALARTEERIQALDATLTAGSLRGPYQIEGQARLRGRALEFAVSTGQLALAGDTPVTVTLALPETGDAAARFNGVLSAGEAARAEGDLTVSGDNLLALADLLAPDAELLGSLAQPYDLTSRVSYGDDRFEFAAIDLSMADTSASGEIGFVFGDPTEVTARLEVARLDLDALLADGGGGGQDPAPAEAGGFRLPDSLRGQLDLQIGTLVYRGEVVRQILVHLDLQQGRLALNQALALLPGGGNVVLSGDLTAEAGQPRFVGRIEAAADSLRGVLNWLGLQVGGVSGDRLRRASLLADLDATPQQVSVTGIDLEVDTSRITGGVALALRERLGIGLGLTVDRINLDAYLLDENGTAHASEAAAEQPERTEKSPAEETAQRPAEGSGVVPQPEPGPEPEQLSDPTAVLGAVDANIDLTLGQVTYNGQSAREVSLEGTLQQGRLSLRRLTVGDLAGGAFSLSGVFTGLPATPSVEDGSFDITVNDTGRLSRLLGQPADGPLARLGGFRASGSASGSAQGFTYNADVSALGGSVFSSGRVSGLPDAVAVADARLEASGLEGAALARLAGQSGDSPLARLDRLDLTSAFDYADGSATYDTRLKTLGAEFVAEGSASELTSGLPAVDFRFAAIHDDLATLLRRVLDESPLSPGSGKLDLRAQVTGSPLKLQISEIRGDLGPTIESGTISLDLARATPFVSADLETREIDLARLFGDGGGGGQDPAARWSRRPLELAVLREVDAELALDATVLRQGDLVLEPATVRAGLEDGVLTLQRFEGTLYEGRLSASGRLDASGDQPAAGATLALAGLDAGAFLRAQGTDRVRGRLDLEAELSSRGNSEAALVTALQGQASLGGDLTVEAQAQEQVGSIVLGILGQQVKELRGVTNPLNELFSAFAGRPGRLSGTVQVAQGVATTDDLQLVGDGATLRARGTLADLPAWRMALATALYRQNSDDPQVQIDLTGALDEPNVRLKGAALSITPGSAAPEPANPLEQILRNAIPGGRQGSGDPLQISPEPPAGEENRQPSGSSAPKPADVLRGLIQGLGKGG